jgi:3-deoxy-7-phosphoheptulonate synthase
MAGARIPLPVLVVLQPGCSEDDRRRVEDAMRGAGCEPRPVAGTTRTVVAAVGDPDRLREVPLEAYPGVAQVLRVTKPYTLASREFRADPTTVRVGRAVVGGGGFTIVAGPCAVEDYDSLVETARAVKAAGADLLRGGAYKPRTSPYAFRGLGLEGLRMLREASRATGLPTVSEVTDPRHVEACVSNVDMLQVGTRNMSNFDLLVEVGRTGHPVLLKRGREATVEEWLLAAEYVLAQGNMNVVLCERGVRGFDPATRNLLDLAAVPVVRARSHLPVLVDPSHGTGLAAYVPSMARAACAAGADGVMVEVHVRPHEARSDAAQALRPEEFADLAIDLRLLRAALAPRDAVTPSRAR